MPPLGLLVLRVINLQEQILPMSNRPPRGRLR